MTGFATVEVQAQSLIQASESTCIQFQITTSFSEKAEEVNKLSIMSVSNQSQSCVKVNALKCLTTNLHDFPKSLENCETFFDQEAGIQ